MMPASYLHGPLAPSTPSPKKRKRPSQTRVIDLTSPSPTSTPSISTPRRPRKPKNADDTSSPEKRVKRYRDHPPQSVMVKHERVMTQRMFLVERSGRQNGALQEDFSVLGSTGNVYIVNVSMVPTCTCPDFLKNQVHCKHILFVLLKVLKLPDPFWYQPAFLTSELEEIFTKVEDSRHSVSDRVKEHYKNLKSGNAPAADAADESGRKPLEGDCPICFEDLTESTVEETVFCKAMCGNNIHKECFNQWARNKRQEGSEVTCVYCRTRWDDGKGKAKAGDEAGEEGYMNLGKMIGASPVRDTSTYHYQSTWYSGGGGRGRGKRWR